LLLRDGDLENLRDKYKELAERLEAREELLRQLQSKLLTASKVARNLQNAPKRQPSKTTAQIQNRRSAKEKNR